MELKDLFKKSNFDKLSNKIKNLDTKKVFNNIEKLLSFSKGVDSVVIVDISSKLTLLHLGLKGQIRLEALKVTELADDKRDEIILKALGDFIRENNIQHKNAILKPSLKSLLIKRIQLPAVPDAELPEAIKWQLKEEVPFELSKAVMDFSVIKTTAKEDGSKVEDIICVLAQEEEIKDQVLLLKQAGLTCLAVGLLPFGYAALIEKYFEQETEAIGVLHLEDDLSYLSIYKDRKLEFYRELPISINKLKESLRGVLVSDKGRIELTPEEVGEVLYQIGVPQEGAGFKDKLNSTQILSMLRPTLERLTGEVKRSFTYYDSAFSGGEVKKILIAGLASKIPNLEKFLREGLSIDVSTLSLSDKIMLSTNINPKILPESYASLGIALDYQNKINLLPYEFRTEKIEKLEKVSLRWIAFIVFLLLIVSYLFSRGGVSGQKKRLDNTLLHLNTLSQVREVKVKVDELNNFIREAKDKQISIGIMFKKLSNITPTELFIEDFSLGLESKSGTIRGVVRCIKQNPDSILTQFIRVLERSAYFADANISSVKKSKEEPFEIAEFQITIKLP